MWKEIRNLNTAPSPRFCVIDQLCGRQIVDLNAGLRETGINSKIGFIAGNTQECKKIFRDNTG